MYTEAEQLFREILDREITFFGWQDQHTLTTVHFLALTLHDQGKATEAEEYFSKLTNLVRGFLGSGDALAIAYHEAITQRDRSRQQEARGPTKAGTQTSCNQDDISSRESEENVFYNVVRDPEVERQSPRSGCPR